jgi:hypothetical protein
MPENVFARDPEQPVNIDRSAVRQVNAANVRLEQSAVQRLNAEYGQLSRSAAASVSASTVELRDSAVALAIADYARVEDSRVLVLLAPRVSGNVRAVISPASAFAIGAGMFVAARVLSILLGGKD